MRIDPFALILTFCTGCLAGYKDVTPVTSYNDDWVTDFRDRSGNQTEAIVVLVAGDPGNVASIVPIAQAAIDVCELEGCDFAITTGDNFYENGITGVQDPLIQDAFRTPWGALAADGGFHFFPVLGNHDWRGDVQAQLDYTAHGDNASHLWIMPHINYAVPLLPDWLQMFAFDTTTVIGGWEDEANGDPAAWLTTQVENAPADSWKVIVGHHFALGTLASHARECNDWMSIQEAIRPAVQAGAQVMFSGHDHVQEVIRSTEWDPTEMPGCANSPAWEGDAHFLQVIQGASSKTRTDVLKNGVINDFADIGFGFTIARFTRDKLVLKFYDGEGTPLPGGVLTYAREDITVRLDN